MEEKWIELARKGDEESFARLMEAHQAKVYSLALRMVTNPDDAAELTQETFLRVWRGLDQFQGNSSFSTWVYRLASNTCIDFLRKEKRRRAMSMTVPVEEDEEDRQAELPDTRFDPHGELEKKELRAAIDRGLAALSDEHREILLLREVSGLSYAEIAVMLDLEEGTVKSRIARARLALRKILLSDGNFSAAQSSV